MEIEKRCPKCNGTMIVTLKKGRSPVEMWECQTPTCRHEEPMYGREEEGTP